MKLLHRHDKGIIEKKEILTDPNGLALFKYFLLIVDSSSHKLLSTYGPFDTPELVVHEANIHGVTIG